MTVEVVLFDALKELTDNRVFPDVAPENTATPYITYQQVGGDAVNFLDSAVPDKKNGRFQINVWSTTRLGASTLAREVEDVLRSVASLQTTVIGAAESLFEPDTGLRGTRQDFSFWFDS